MTKNAETMTGKAKLSWALGIATSMLALLAYAQDFENPLRPFILSVVQTEFASVTRVAQIETKVDKAIEKQSEILAEFAWQKKQTLETELFSTRKEQCAAETEFQKDFYHRKMTDLTNRYREAYGYEYRVPECRDL